MKRKILLVTLVLIPAFLGAADCDEDKKAPPINIPTDVTPNGDPRPGGSCKGGPSNTTVIDGKTYECYDRHWRPKK